MHASCEVNVNLPTYCLDLALSTWSICVPDRETDVLTSDQQEQWSVQLWHSADTILLSSVDMHASAIHKHTHRPYHLSLPHAGPSLLQSLSINAISLGTLKAQSISHPPHPSLTWLHRISAPVSRCKHPGSARLFSNLTMVVPLYASIQLTSESIFCLSRRGA